MLEPTWHGRLNPAIAISCCCKRPYSIVKTGTVSPHRKVPASIKKPPYAGWLKRTPTKTKEVEIKKDSQIQGMHEVGKIASDILNLAGERAQAGVTTDEIDEFVHGLCIAKRVYPSPLRYLGFPKSVCTSVNNVACHGIPDDRRLEDGDIVNIDITVRVFLSIIAIFLRKKMDLAFYQIIPRSIHIVVWIMKIINIVINNEI